MSHFGRKKTPNKSHQISFMWDVCCDCVIFNGLRLSEEPDILYPIQLYLYNIPFEKKSQVFKVEFKYLDRLMARMTKACGVMKT